MLGNWEIQRQYNPLQTNVLKALPWHVSLLVSRNSLGIVLPIKNLPLV